MSTRPQLQVIDGDGLADDPRHDAYRIVAEAAERALRVPGLPADDVERLVRVAKGTRRASITPRLRPRPRRYRFR